MTGQKLRVRHARAPSTATRGRHGKLRRSLETQESCGASRHSPLRPESIKLPRMNEEGCCMCPAAWRYVSAGALQVRSARVFARASWARDNAARRDSPSHARCQATLGPTGISLQCPLCGARRLLTRIGVPWPRADRGKKALDEGYPHISPGYIR